MKKGVSEMVAYVLLVVIAIGISVLMFAYIKNFIPKNTVECPDEVSLILTKVDCTKATSELVISVMNKGTFDISGFIIKASNSDREPTTGLKVIPKITPDDGLIGYQGGTGEVYFVKKDASSDSFPLPPGEDINQIKFPFPKKPQVTVDWADITSISIQPMWGVENSLCKNSIITEKVTCV